MSTHLVLLDKDKNMSSMLSFPPGMILLWGGQLNTIPEGWTLCDGSRGSPDLTDLFVMGAGTTSDQYPGTRGGNNMVMVPNVQHSHDRDVYINQCGYRSGTYVRKGQPAGIKMRSTHCQPDVNNPIDQNPPQFNPSRATVSEYGTSAQEAVDITPPFVYLCFIMKLQPPAEIKATDGLVLSVDATNMGNISPMLFPVGMICMWPIFTDIPVGWILCDGTNGTPNLLDVYVRCAKNETGKLPLITGGRNSVVLSENNFRPHTHDVKMWNGNNDQGSDDFGNNLTAFPRMLSTPSDLNCKREYDGIVDPNCPGNYLPRGGEMMYDVGIVGTTSEFSTPIEIQLRPPIFFVQYIMKIQ